MRILIDRGVEREITNTSWTPMPFALRRERQRRERRRLLTWRIAFAAAAVGMTVGRLLGLG